MTYHKILHFSKSASFFDNFFKALMLKSKNNAEDVKKEDENAKKKLYT